MIFNSRRGRDQIIGIDNIVQKSCQLFRLGVGRLHFKNTINFLPRRAVIVGFFGRFTPSAIRQKARITQVGQNAIRREFHCLFERRFSQRPEVLRNREVFRPIIFHRNGSPIRFAQLDLR